MINVIRELLAIEKSARQTEGEENHNETEIFIQDEINRGVITMERDADARIAALIQESYAQTEERLAQIREAYRRKTDRLEAAFIINRETWSAEIVKDILQ
ncbi:MAG: hypothetical protein FWE90_12000 [Defluviitaleaceae bacterium]|nr:hypothetical protein [Defluviitaleaceae bacterium]